MKALVFDAFGQPLRKAEVADPTCGADEVVLKICRCGICGSDLHMTEDQTFGLQGGEVIGHEFAGEVLEVGRAVTTLRPGDLVAAAPIRGCGHCAACRAGQPAWCENGMTLIGGGYGEFTRWRIINCARCRSTCRWPMARWRNRWRSRCTG